MRSGSCPERLWGGALNSSRERTDCRPKGWRVSHRHLQPFASSASPSEVVVHFVILVVVAVCSARSYASAAVLLLSLLAGLP